jgi:hypothetical protein
MRKIRENLRAYGGLAAMCTLTAPGVDAGLAWDRASCTHDESERCGRAHGCKVVPGVAQLWNEKSRGWWSKLNRVCKQRADRAVRRQGLDRRGGVLLYEWELQVRGVWHLHFVLGMETAWERVWALEYVKAMRELAPKYGFGFVDAKPLRNPEPAERVARYLSKYLAKWKEDGTLEITETVKSAGRSLLNYVSRADGEERLHDAEPAARADRVGVALGTDRGSGARSVGRARRGLSAGSSAGAGARTMTARRRRPRNGPQSRIAQLLHWS